MNRSLNRMTRKSQRYRPLKEKSAVRCHEWRIGLNFLKKSSPKSDSAPPAKEPVEKPSLYIHLKKEINPLRKQGEPPAKVPSSFGRYFCDLCNSQFPVEELRQCSICG